MNRQPAIRGATNPSGQLSRRRFLGRPSAVGTAAAVAVLLLAAPRSISAQPPATPNEPSLPAEKAAITANLPWGTIEEIGRAHV